MPEEQDSGSITQLLRDWRSGNEAALERLTPLVYAELRRLAQRMFRSESAGHTLQPTALGERRPSRAWCAWTCPGRTVRISSRSRHGSCAASW
ncbi:MAG: hypothetical protein HC872_01610 [Gammaproteobacteria bacterium]|nr:hypothetical protein [Gammaproteobacteria bacterium]